MASVSYGSKPTSNITLTGSKASVNITSVSVGTTETTIVVPAGTVALKFKIPESGGACKLYLASTVTGSTTEATRYEISAGNEYIEEGMSGSSVTYYVSASKNGQTLQIIYWS